MPDISSHVLLLVQRAVSVLAGYPAGTSRPGGGAVSGAEPHTLLQR